MNVIDELLEQGVGKPRLIINFSLSSMLVSFLPIDIKYSSPSLILWHFWMVVNDFIDALMWSWTPWLAKYLSLCVLIMCIIYLAVFLSLKRSLFFSIFSLILQQTTQKLFCNSNQSHNLSIFAIIFPHIFSLISLTRFFIFSFDSEKSFSKVLIVLLAFCTPCTNCDNWF